MSIIHFDGFDHYTGVGPGGRKWDQGSASNAFVTGRFGGLCVPLVGSGNGFAPTWSGMFKSFPTDFPSLIVGAAIRVNSFGTPGQINHPFLMFSDDSTVQTSLWIDPDTQVIQLRTGRGTEIGYDVLATGSFVPPLTLWFYLEVKITIGNPGSCIVRINGNEIINAGGVQTQQSGNATTNKVHFTGIVTFSSYVDVDDVYIIDPNDSTDAIDFLGEVRVQTKYPDADGFQTDFLRSTGGVNANNVNATLTSYTETGLYNYSGAPGAKDLYSIGNFTVSGTIFAVQENLSFRKDDVGSRNVATLLRTASVEYEGDSVPCYSSYTHTGKIWETNPNTASPWSLTDLNQAEFGIKVTA